MCIYIYLLYNVVFFFTIIITANNWKMWCSVLKYYNLRVWYICSISNYLQYHFIHIWLIKNNRRYLIFIFIQIYWMGGVNFEAELSGWGGVLEVLFLQQQVLGNSGLSYLSFSCSRQLALGLLGLVLLGSRSPPLFAMSLLFFGMVFP